MDSHVRESRAGQGPLGCQSAPAHVRGFARVARSGGRWISSWLPAGQGPLDCQLAPVSPPSRSRARSFGDGRQTSELCQLASDYWAVLDARMSQVS